MQLSLSGADALQVLKHPMPLLIAAGVTDEQHLGKGLAAFETFRDYRSCSLQKMVNPHDPDERIAKASMVTRLGNLFVTAFDDRLGITQHTLYVHFIAAGHVADQIRDHGNRMDGITQTLERRHQTFKGHKCTNGAKPTYVEQEDGTRALVPARCIPRIAQAVRHAGQERHVRLTGMVEQRPTAHVMRKRKQAWQEVQAEFLEL